MAKEYGQAGKSTRELQKKRKTNKIFFTLFGFGLSIFIYLLTINTFTNSKGVLAFIVAILGLITIKIMLNIVDDEHKSIGRLEKRAAKGAKAEEDVGYILSKLPNHIVVFHDIESPYGNIDHVVINTKNNVIFLLETKSHNGTVTFDGTSLLIDNKSPEKNFFSQILKNTYWLKDSLEKQTGASLFVYPILVFTNAFVKIHKPIKGIHIVNKKYLTGKITEISENVKINGKNNNIDLCTALKRINNLKDNG